MILDSDLERLLRKQYTQKRAPRQRRGSEEEASFLGLLDDHVATARAVTEPE